MKSTNFNFVKLRASLISVLGTFIMLSSVQATANGIPLAVNLQSTAQSADQSKIPVVIFYTAKWCHYCHVLERNILEPLLETTEIEQYAEFRKISLSEADWQLKDFNGNTVSMENFAVYQDAQFTPTTMLYNKAGKSIAEPIIGLTLEEFYPGNLEKAINQALKALDNPKRLNLYEMIENSKGRS